MVELLIHPRTQLQLESFSSSPSHAVIINGPSGIGKGAVAGKLATDLMDIKGTDNQPYLRTLASVEGKAIGIESIRELDSFLSLKVPGTKATNRIVIIEDADLMTHEAQNALLKTLEEPPKGTVMILTASYTEGLLPTIRSRAQTITIQVPAVDDIKAYFSDYASKDVSQAHAITGGLPGLMSALLSDESHPLMDAVEQAKKFISSTPYERLIQADFLAKNRKLTDETLYIIQQMAHISLQSAQGKAAQRWQKIMESAFNASKALNQNAQIKLTLTNLSLSF